MGARANIMCHYSDGGKVNFYSHWDGDGLAYKLKAALKRQERWDDEMYLARIIFCEMVKDEIDGETGYGISPYVGEEEYKTLHVNFDKQTVNGTPFSEFIN